MVAIIKVMKDGTDAFANSLKAVEENFQLIENIIKEIDYMLSSGEWTGLAMEQCVSIHKLTEIYRKYLRERYTELERININLRYNINTFINNQVVIDLK